MAHGKKAPGSLPTSLSVAAGLEPITIPRKPYTPPAASAGRPQRFDEAQDIFRENFGWFGAFGRESFGCFVHPALAVRTAHRARDVGKWNDDVAPTPGHGAVEGAHPAPGAPPMGD